MKRARRVSTILYFLGLVLVSGCGGRVDENHASLKLKAAFLTEIEVRALVDPDPQVFSALAEHLGSDRLIRISKKFVQATFADSSGTGSEREALLPAYRQVTSALAELNRCFEFQAELHYLLNLDPGEAGRVLAVARKQEGILSDSDLSADERLKQVSVTHTALMAAGYDLAVAAGWTHRGTLATRTGQPALARELFTAGLTHARQNKLRTSRCNALASLVMQGFADGKTDSTTALLDRGLNLARESRLGPQTARLLVLTGYQDFNLGHYSMAVRYFEESIAACRNDGSPDQSLAHLGTLSRMYAVMESWTLVDQLAQRAEILLTEAEAAPGSSYRSSMLAIRQDELLARSLMARGKVDEAHAAYGSLWERAMAQPFEEASFLANYWIMGLLDHQRTELATAALAQAEPYARQAGIRHMLLRLNFWHARAFFQKGQLDSANVYLDRFAAEGLRQRHGRADLQIPYFALRVRLLAESDQEAAAAFLAEGLSVLVDRLATNDAGAGAFLDLARARGLRWSAHDAFGADPVTGYGLELMWRRFLRVIGTDLEPPFAAQTNVRAEALRAGTRASERLKTSGAMHLLYQVREPWVVRWTVSGGLVQQDTLSVPTSELRRIVGRAQMAMSTDPGDPDAVLGPELSAMLGELAHLLLPDSLLRLDPGRWPSTLLISGEGFLSQIPFTPLDVGSNLQYVPLAALTNLSWVRSTDDRHTRIPGGQSLLIANPQIDPVLTRRYPMLGPLVGVDAEMTSITNIYPGKILSEATATKAAVEAAWSSCSMIYFMGHVIHNPEVPFLTTIPLTPPLGSHRLLESALDVGDIRRADLSRCRLVVLSGCGSGVPFVDGVITAPSLGDAFLDAGAGGSLQTFWRIRDDKPVFRPEDVVRLWKTEGLSLPEALSAVRREALLGPRGIRHPFGWAAWSLKLGQLPD